MIKIFVENAIEIIQISMLLFFAISMMRERLIEKSVTAGLYTLGTVIYIVTDVYWIAHLLIKSGQAPQFSTAEIGVMGVVLFYGAAIRARMQPRHQIAWISYPVILAAVFTLANTVCWFLWNGGLIRDILTGIAMGYFACVLAARMDELGLVSRRQWCITAAVIVVLMAVEVGTVYASGALVLVLDVIRYALWFAGVAYFCVMIYRFMLNEKIIEEGLCYSFAGYLWCVFILYLSADTMYTIANALVTLMMIPVWMAVRWEVIKQ